MSFLAEVLAIKDEALIIDIKEKVPILDSQVEKLKHNVKTYIDDQFIILSSSRNKNNELLQQANALNERMDELKVQIEQVTKKDIKDSELELDSSMTDLKETMYSLQLATQLVNINEALTNNKLFMKQKKYADAAEQISIARKLISEMPSEGQLNIIKAINININLELNSLLSVLSSVWQEMVIYEKEELNDRTDIKLKIGNSSDDFGQILKAFYHENQTTQLNTFSNYLLNDVLKPIINETTLLKVFTIDKFAILDIKIKKPSKKMEYNFVFENIQNVFEFLNATINYRLDNNLLVVQYIGDKIRDEFCEYFIQNCLADTVPSTQEGLNQYKEVIVEIETLQNTLTDCDFFSKNNSSLLEYVENVDVLFANKVCQMYTDKAILILKKDLYDTVEVDLGLSQNQDKNLIITKCCVSRSACEYLNLVRKILDQTCEQDTDICAKKLLYTAKQMIELYCKSIPEYHKKLLETIPQQVAIFHNNCMFLSHELITFDNYYIEKISSNVTAGESFDYQIQYLRSCGTDIFLKFMRSQIKQVEDILNGSELATLGQIEKLDPNCEKSLRQCLRQLEILKNVWQKVLTYEVYNKTIGELLNSFIKHLIKLVLNVEDISADTSTLLVEMFKIVQDRGPKLFTEPKEIHLYTKSWYKFNELALLLNSSLSDINDRWADGKGPLAVEYSPDDIRRMIRALFQNTDRRSAVLSKIN